MARKKQAPIEINSETPFPAGGKPFLDKMDPAEWSYSVKDHFQDDKCVYCGHLAGSHNIWFRRTNPSHWKQRIQPVHETERIQCNKCSFHGSCFLASEEPQLTFPKFVAVRPYLGKAKRMKHHITVHPVNSKGKPNYGKALMHIAPDERIHLLKCRPHINHIAAGKIRRGEKSKYPAMSIIGIIESFYQPKYAITHDCDYNQIKYNPKTDKHMKCSYLPWYYAHEVLCVPGAGFYEIRKGKRRSNAVRNSYA